MAIIYFAIIVAESLLAMERSLSNLIHKEEGMRRPVDVT